MVRAMRLSIRGVVMTSDHLQALLVYMVLMHTINTITSHYKTIDNTLTRTARLIFLTRTED